MGVRFGIITDLHYGADTHSEVSWDAGDIRIGKIYEHLKSCGALALFGIGDQWQDSWGIDTDGARGISAFRQYENMPTHFIPGNHENNGGTGDAKPGQILSLFTEYGLGQNQLRNNYTIDYGDYRFILFDSCEYTGARDEAGGRVQYIVPDDTISWLNGLLTTTRSELKKAIVCCHACVDAIITLQGANIESGQTNVLKSTGGVRILYEGHIGGKVALVFANDVIKYTTILSVNTGGDEVTVSIDETLPGTEVVEWYYIGGIGGSTHGWHVKNQKDLRDLFQQYTDIILGVLQGHMKDDCPHSEIQNIKYFHFRECQSDPIIGIIEIDESGISVAGNGPTVTHNWFDYYIDIQSVDAADNQNGSLPICPWGNISFLIVKPQLHVGGVKVNICNGVYPAIYQGSDSPLIGISGDPVQWIFKPGAIINGNATASTGLRLQKNNYLNIHNIKIENCLTTSSLIYTSGANVNFFNSTLIGPATYGFRGNGGIYGIDIENVTLPARLENNCIFTNFYIRDGGYGSGISFYGTINNVVVAHGIVIDGDSNHTGAAGIYIAEGKVVKVYNVIITNCGAGIRCLETTATIANIWCTDGNNIGVVLVGTSDPEISDIGKLSPTSPCIDKGAFVAGINMEGQLDPWGKKVHSIPNIGVDQGAGAPKKGSHQILQLGSNRGFFS